MTITATSHQSVLIQKASEKLPDTYQKATNIVAAKPHGMTSTDIPAR